MATFTRNAGFTHGSHPTMFDAENTCAVVRGDEILGFYGRNKHGVTIGVFGAKAVDAASRGKNPFLPAVGGTPVEPTTRDRNRRMVARDIAKGIAWVVDQPQPDAADTTVAA
jgi:hypothetical protein